MSRAERLKEELGWLKLYFAAFLAIDVSVIAWLAQNYRKADTVILAGAFVIIIVITCLLVWVNRRAYKRIEQLEDA
ncbi:MAG: hypothetical protein ACREVE_14790 [Gammaproteobacteria bacterium]